ncbi:unnamed protein product [Agarophyton chilense]
MDRTSRSPFSLHTAASFALACLSIGMTSWSFRKSAPLHGGSVNVYNAWNGVGMHAVPPLVLDSESSTNRTNWEIVRTAELQAGLERVEAGAWIPPHSHNTEEIVLVYEGQGYVHFENGRKTAIQKGSMIHIVTGVHHAFQNAADQPMWLMWCFPVLEKGEAFQFRQRY